MRNYVLSAGLKMNFAPLVNCQRRDREWFSMSNSKRRKVGASSSGETTIKFPPGIELASRHSQFMFRCRRMKAQAVWLSWKARQCSS